MFSRSATRAVRPGFLLDWYPENVRPQPQWLSQSTRSARCLLDSRRMRFAAFRRRVQQVDHHAAEFARCSPAEQLAMIRTTRLELLRNGFSAPHLLRAFGLIKAEVQELFGFALHDEQLFCAWALMHGHLPEMATGEGKSITAGLAATVAALAGIPVHVITTNDYLVARDAESMQKLFARFGVSSGYVHPDQDDQQRQDAYDKDVCYVSNKQLVFDYLRDRQVLGNQPSSLASGLRAVLRPGVDRPLLRGLCFAIVDEADSVLIDDAITPLILSRQAASAESDIAQALTAISLARRLQPGADFRLDGRVKSVSILESGEERLSESVRGLDATWKNRRFRHELVRQALSALHMFERDIDYLVRDGEVILIDQSTGRVMPDRRLQHGLHQMLEIKEQCELSGRSETLSSMSFQTFFGRYKHLCGMTGTASEAISELRRVYGLAVVKVPTHSPNQRLACPARFAADQEQHQSLLLRAVTERHKSGQPVLVGTRSLAQSEALSELLNQARLLHTVLNARQDEDEAAVVSRAGARGAITIATNIAGRGTDIPVSKSVSDLGGLHVIVAELNDNARIDRQLVGRCGRQGNPGSYEYLLSLDDALLQRHAANQLRWVNRVKNMTGEWAWYRLCMVLARRIQNSHERRQRLARKQVAAADMQMQKRLAFTGYKE